MNDLLITLTSISIGALIAIRIHMEVNFYKFKREMKGYE